MSPVYYDEFGPGYKPVVVSPKPVAKPATVATAAPAPGGGEEDPKKKKASVFSAPSFTPLGPAAPAKAAPVTMAGYAPPGGVTPFTPSFGSQYAPTGKTPYVPPGGTTPFTPSPEVRMAGQLTPGGPLTKVPSNAISGNAPGSTTNLGQPTSGVASMFPGQTMSPSVGNVAPAAPAAPVAPVDSNTPPVQAPVDPEQAKYALYGYAKRVAAGMMLSPEELADLQATVIAASGLDQPIRVIDPQTRQVQEAVLGVGETAVDEYGMTRGVRVNLILGIMGKYNDTPEDIAAIASQQVGGGGLTLDEIQMVFPYATDRNLGANWANTPGAMDAQGGQGYVMKSPNGLSPAPIFSGFYLAGDGRYYPLNTAELARQGFGKQKWVDYSYNKPNRPARQQPASATEQESINADTDLENASGGSLGQLSQNLQ